MEINSGVSTSPQGSIKVEFARNGSKIIQVLLLKSNRRNRKQNIQKKKVCLLDQKIQMNKVNDYLSLRSIHPSLTHSLLVGDLILDHEGTLMCHDHVVICILAFIASAFVVSVLGSVMLEHLFQNRIIAFSSLPHRCPTQPPRLM